MTVAVDHRVLVHRLTRLDQGVRTKVGAKRVVDRRHGARLRGAEREKFHDNETAATAIGFWQRAVAWYAARGVTIERVLSDNGSCYRSRAWRQACTELGIATRYTRPYRPQTNGKAERFNRTLINEWAFVRPYPNEAARRAALPAFLHTYNHHRPHTALGGRPPISRLTNVSGQYN